MELMMVETHKTSTENQRLPCSVEFKPPSYTI